MLYHLVFDLLALAGGVLGGLLFRRKYQLVHPAGIKGEEQYHYYLLALLVGLISGALLFGTGNLYLAGHLGIAKSMLGGIAGAVIAVELFKYFAGIRQSTGLYFVPGLIVMIAIGRIGCFLGGLPDFTYGTPSNLVWAVDFGDGIRRHPVQLYESLGMLALLAMLLATYPKYPAFWRRQGFYIFVLVYAGQRFLWEFIKPYPPLLANLNLFHLLSLFLLAYAGWMLLQARSDAK